MFKTLFATVTLGGALVLAGCAATPQTAETSAPVQSQQQRPGGGVSGLIAAASDTVLQVQSTDEQTAVSYTADTTISAQVAGSVSDIAVGDCVVAITPADAGTAQSVIVTDAVDGECTGGFGGGGPAGGGPAFDGELPDGAPTDFPTDGTAPSGAPTDFAGNGDFGAFANGPVTAIDGDTITVDARGADDATTSTEVTVGDDTTITVTVAADASVLVVGQCVTAQGEADDAGGFAATSLTVSEPGDEGCTPRMFGGQFPGGGPGTAENG